jgi:predicted TIM-barrel fold metal-dependent hydrolase
MFNPRESALNSLNKFESQSSFSNIEINTVISRQKAEKNDILYDNAKRLLNI